MKKISLLLIMALLCSMLFASCAKDEKDKNKDVDLSDPTLSIYDCVDLPYQYDLSKYITVEKSDYMGLEVTKIDTTLTDEDLTAAIDAALAEAAIAVDVTDRGAETGDTLVIDFKGSVDGDYFSGGEATDHEMVLGEAGFIEGFEEALVGHKANEEFVIDVTFPEDYTEELAGKDAKFEIKIKSIKTMVLPDLNEEFVLNNSDCKTVEEYITQLTEKASLEKIENAESEQQGEAFAKIFTNAEIKELPEDEYEFYYNDYVSYYEQMAQSYYGIDLKTFITDVAGSTEDEFYYYADVNATQMVEQELIIFAIAKAENLLDSLKKADYDAHLLELAEYYETDAATLESQSGALEVWKSLIFEKVIDFVMENSVEVEPKEETEITEEPIIIEGTKVTE